MGPDDRSMTEEDAGGGHRFNSGIGLCPIGIGLEHRGDPMVRSKPADVIVVADNRRRGVSQE
jgi:hypothetical protein